MHKIKLHIVLIAVFSLLPVCSFAAGIPAEIFIIPAILVIAVFVAVIILIVYGVWGVRKKRFNSRKKIFVFNFINVILFILLLFPIIFLTGAFAILPKLIIFLPSFMQIYLFFKVQAVNA